MSRAPRPRAASAPETLGGWSVQWEAAADYLRRMPAGGLPGHNESRYPAQLTSRYDLGLTVGEGGFSKVKVARHRLTGIKVAIKIINKSSMLERNELYRVANEITALQLLKHQNICQLYHVLETSSRVFIVTEYLPAGELFDYVVAQGRIRNEDTARDIFRQIVKAIAYCHSQGFSHRDLKPENMLFDAQLQLKLIDFGLVAVPFQNTTQTSCGSCNYAAPEVIAGNPYHAPAADLWSLGICLYAMLCGFLPFEHSNLRCLGDLIRKGEFARPPYLSPMAIDLLEGLINVDPDSRMTMDELLQHPWMLEGTPLGTERLDFASTVPTEMDPVVLQVMSTYYGVSEDMVRQGVENEVFDHVVADYMLLVRAKAERIPLMLGVGAGRWEPRPRATLPPEVAERLRTDEMEAAETQHGANEPSLQLATSNESMTVSTTTAASSDADDGEWLRSVGSDGEELRQQQQQQGSSTTTTAHGAAFHRPPRGSRAPDLLHGVDSSTWEQVSSRTTNSGSPDLSSAYSSALTSPAVSPLVRRRERSATDPAHAASAAAAAMAASRQGLKFTYDQEAFDENKELSATDAESVNTTESERLTAAEEEAEALARALEASLAVVPEGHLGVAYRSRAATGRLNQLLKTVLQISEYDLRFVERRGLWDIEVKGQDSMGHSASVRLQMELVRFSHARHQSGVRPKRVRGTEAAYSQVTHHILDQLRQVDADVVDVVPASPF